MSKEIKTPGDILSSALSDLQKSMNQIPVEIREQRAKDGNELAWRQRKQRITQLLTESRVPQRQCNNNNIIRTGEWGESEAKIKAKLGTGCFLALVGTRGCGKTQLGVEAIRLCAEQGKRSRYCTATEFFMEIKAAYDSVTRSEKDIVQEFTRPSLLVIDEIGQRSESEWENRLLFELLNRRYNALKDTILVSNQSAEAFSKALGPSLISRMQETGGLIECNWPTYRK